MTGKKDENFNVLTAAEAAEQIRAMANLGAMDGLQALTAGLPGVPPPPRYSYKPALWRSDRIVEWCRENREALASMPRKVAHVKSLP